jgi:hypothetical protein
MKWDKTDGTYITHGRDKERKQNFSRKNLKGRDHVEDLNVDWRINQNGS